MAFAEEEEVFAATFAYTINLSCAVGEVVRPSTVLWNAEMV